MTILFFAQCADWAARRRLDLSLPAPVRLDELMAREPALAPLRGRPNSFKIAVNHAFADPTQEVHDGDEVAFLPPFSGG